MEHVNFPSWWNIHNDRVTHINCPNSHGTGRALFGDWGRFGNVHAYSENGNVQCNFQFDGSVPFVVSAIPYYIDDVISNSELNYNLNPYLFISDREKTLNKYRHLRQLTKRAFKYKKKGSWENYVSAVRNNRSRQHLNKVVSSCVPPSLIYVANNYWSYLSHDRVQEACKTSSSMYSGGCIKTFILGDDLFVARCAGKNLGSLRIDKYDDELTQVYQSDNGASIFEIDALILREECRLLIRRGDKLSMFVVQNNGDSVTVVETSVINKVETCPWLCSRQNQRWSEELVATNAEGIRVYDINNMETIWQKQTTCLSAAVDSWNEVVPVLPMQWIHTTRVDCSLVDGRKSPFSGAKDLFSVKHPSFSDKESLCHTSALFDGHYFNLWSSFNGNLMDIRMPGRQVVQWAAPMLSPVSYSCHLSDTTMTGEVTQWAVGCQLQARHCVYEQNSDTHGLCSALGSQDVEGSHPSATMSLGLAMTRDGTDGVISVLTLDHHGRVLCHRYRRDGYDYPPHPETHTLQHCFTSATPIIDDCIFDPIKTFTNCDTRFEYTVKSSETDKVRLTAPYLRINTTKPFRNEEVFNL